ncbi:MAG: hypothetical protein K2Y12_14355 [Chitinophagaceae bacterium]|jgi:predicted YcjX-like family ATPase|nr:hypothetical protein [Chitinophagaceae bacterium]HAK10712.1 hypothetical protein [Chitinophagaceae bacterium]HCT22650.1 hypothetical protein [Chitinophagaceae bacterium]
MKNVPYHLLVNAAGQLMQQHAFDHLTDDKLSRMQNCIRTLSQEAVTKEAINASGHELLALCREADLYVDTTTPQSLQQLFAAMSYFGVDAQSAVTEEVY